MSVRASLILVADEATANKVLADPRSRGGIENAGFRDLVTQYASTDAETKERGGDLRFSTPRNLSCRPSWSPPPSKLVNIGDASLAIKIGAVTPCSSSPGSAPWALADLWARGGAADPRQALSRTPAEADGRLRAVGAQEVWIAINDAQLAQVRRSVQYGGAPDDPAKSPAPAAIIRRPRRARYLQSAPVP